MARYRQPEDTQWQFTMVNFSKLFPEDHPLAQLMATIRKLDLSEFDAAYKNDTEAREKTGVACGEDDGGPHLLAAVRWAFDAES